jgi:REP element-mobilizing transposase RayT
VMLAFAKASFADAHVLLLIALPPDLDLLNNLKTTSSRRLCEEFTEKVQWIYRKPIFCSGS